MADWLTSRGGAERVILNFAELFPLADIYTSVFKATAFPELRGRRVVTSYLQRSPLRYKQQLFPALRPAVFESFDLDAYDLVISSSHAEAKGVITKPETLHICYCHTPTRYYWSHYHRYLRARQLGILDPLVKLVMPSTDGGRYLPVEIAALFIRHSVVADEVPSGEKMLVVDNLLRDSSQ